MQAHTSSREASLRNLILARIAANKARKRNSTDIKYIQKRFWSKVDKKEEFECWNWKASTSIHNYGQFSIHGKPRISSRLAYILTFGAISEDIEVCHKCDNTLCCNPNHLFLGTHADNMKDSVSKGRHVFGERTGGVKLTESKVIQIRDHYSSGKYSHSKLAEMYGVSRREIGAIINRTRWRHI